MTMVSHNDDRVLKPKQENQNFAKKKGNSNNTITAKGHTYICTYVQEDSFNDDHRKLRISKICSSTMRRIVTKKVLNQVDMLNQAEDVINTNNVKQKT